MQKAAPILALALSASACLLPADDTGDAPAEASAALTAAKPALEPEAATWIAENVPHWSVYLGGRGRDLHPGRNPWNKFTNVYYEDPRDSDVFAPVILVRRGDERDPSRWIQLSLTQHWMKGDRYFDELIECGTLTMLDLVVIMSELSKYADSYMEPSPIGVLEAATPDALRELRYRSRFTCKDRNLPRRHALAGMERGPYGPPVPPGWIEGPDTHTYGPGPMGSIDGNGHPLPPDITSTRPSLSQVPPRPSPPRTAEQNGVGPGDPKAKTSPFDEDYEPRPGEARETFKCSGEVFYGYKAACTDLSNTSLAWKWMSQEWNWIWHVPDRLRTAFQDEVINSGTHDDCERHCRYMSYAQFFVAGAIVPAGCILITKSPACVNAANTNLWSQLGAVVVSGATGGIAQSETLAECVKHVCDGK